MINYTCIYIYNICVYNGFSLIALNDLTVLIMAISALIHRLHTILYLYICVYARRRLFLEFDRQKAIDSLLINKSNNNRSCSCTCSLNKWSDGFQINSH